jgi:hypothetical protein
MANGVTDLGSLVAGLAAVADEVRARMAET